MDQRQCGFKNEDVTQEFKSLLQSLSARAPADMNQIFSQMNDENKGRVRHILSTATVEVAGPGGEQQSVARRIVKVARRAPA